MSWLPPHLATCWPRHVLDEIPEAALADVDVKFEAWQKTRWTNAMQPDVDDFLNVSMYYKRLCGHWSR